ncbi:malonyl-coa acp transacylase acp-binding [Holotrichia oblita]|uniref:Malonyl-coa acp transacylase acp-binding n=1 Tax=Holotrichia oblita TaxID=644536 RepID=A0ACB9TWZ5_HOLOL|nr:malonyl-coa acp transacylase acp-binding [Holotrichia oblita]
MNVIKQISIKTLKLNETLLNSLKCNYVHSSALFRNSKKDDADDKNKHESSGEKQRESPLKKLLEDAASFEDVKTKNLEQKWATLPYGESARIQKQGEFVKDKKDPRDSTIILFPGQGSQYVGMANNLLKFPLVKDLFDLASYILQYDLLKLCLEGPKDQLEQTKYCQPAVMVASLAALERLKEERPNAIDNCVATAGFSLGELTALVFAGAIGFEQALQLVKVRAEAMQLAGEVHKGGMARVLYGPDSELKQACQKAKDWARERGDDMPECRIANFLYPDCKVVAGSIAALEFLEKNVKEFKLKKVSRLPVSGAFHSDLMIPAIKPFKTALEKIKIVDPVISVYSNVDGKRYKNADHIRRQLPKQIVKPVKWEQTMHVIYERDVGEYFPRTFECGPGVALRTILKQVNAKAWDYCISVPA